MKFFFLVICIFLLNNSYSQNIDYTLKYYPFTNSAEKAIINEKYNIALKKYKNAINNVPHAFARDLYNASICAIKMNDYEFAIKCVDSLITKGIDKNYLISKASFSPLIKNAIWNDFLAKYPLLISIKEKKINPELLDVFKKMKILDQKYRSSCHSFVNTDSIKKSDSINMNLFLALVSRYGFPSEELLGVDTTMRPKSDFQLILHHHCEKKAYSKTLFNPKNILINSVKAGKYDKYEAAYLLSFLNEDSLYIGEVALTKFKIEDKDSIFNTNKFYRLKPELYSLKKVNRVRKKLGLECLDDYFQKAMYFQKYKDKTDFKFPRPNIEIWILHNIERFDEYLKDYQEIKFDE